MSDLFQRIEDRKDEKSFEVAVTFLEIYNEEIRDLLAEPGSPAPRGGLAIREDKNVKVVNLTELRPSNADEVKRIVLLGNQRRTQSPTHANETSSRSHAVLQVHVTQSPRTANTTETRTMATLSIIDLAGSERASATKNMGERMVEGANINKSLLALGNCINALCESGGTTRHIPYRNSKLTRLLNFSLGGNCKTVMIVCVAPTSLHFEDTHNALIYAERATKIKTKVVTRNVLNVNRHVGQYVEAINRLNEEVTQLKAKLADRQTSAEESGQKKRMEMLGDISRVNSDIALKVNQNKQSIGEGARCKAVLDTAEIKVAAIHNHIQADSHERKLLEAEKVLLSSLAKQQEEMLRKDSVLSCRLQKSKNAECLFDAMLKAVVERRAVSKLDEIGSQNVQLLLKCAKTDIQQHRAEETSKSYREAVEQQTSLIINLVALVARSAVMLREGAKFIQAGAQSDTPSDANMLQNFADSIDRSIADLLGFGVVQMPESLDTIQPSCLRSIWKQNTTTSSKSLRRPSTVNTSPKKAHRSPRKSRISLSKGRAPVKRDSDKKTVRWKEEIQSATDNSLRRSSPSDIPLTCSSEHPKIASSVGSESDWEDEKTEDSLGAGLTSMSMVRSLVVQKRLRNSRLDPAFLRAKEPVLGSLLESGEEDRPLQFSEKINQPISLAVLSKKQRIQNDQRPMPPVSRTTKRVSSIGPMRSSRSRRRSSILLEARSACDENAKPNSVGNESMNSSSRRKRSSGYRPLRSLTSTTISGSNNEGGEASFRGIKPMWR
jgi:kinesin family member 18/19